MLDWNNLIPSDSGWLLIDAMTINDAGQIVGIGRHDGGGNLFLLTPTSVVPEPTTLAFFSLAAAGYVLRRRIIRR